MNREVERELIRTALPYWETEAHITRRFFNGKPSREEHIFWLKAQLWKELHPVDGYFTGLQKELNNLAASFPRSINPLAAVNIIRSSNSSRRSSITTCSWRTFSNIFSAIRFPPRIRFNWRRRKSSGTYAEVTRVLARRSIKSRC